MNKFLVVLLVVAFGSCILAAPQFQQNQNQNQNPPVPIVSQNSQNDGAGNFAYNFETGDGIRQDVQGSLKQVQVPRLAPDGQVLGTEPGSAQVQSGRFSYPSPDGTIIELSWVADENGFQPQGAHLPVPPAPLQ